MIPLHHEKHFTFRFEEDRIIPRFHLADVPFGCAISIYRFEPKTGGCSQLLTTATTGEAGWVDLAEPIIVRAGEGFIVVPSE